ncbi:MAG: hypothetical protein DHS20C08_07360 [Rhodomicrobium sp.]|nr:MAG: hypothetical protein DHS20C08_07360 [Rhodomicrobium sp.]
MLQVSATAKIAICGQAPGTKVHLSGRPFTDRSGERLRDWTGLSDETFYDSSLVAIVPMGFCFPGQTKAGADLPPRPECPRLWHDKLMAELPQLELMLVVGRYAINYHLPNHRRRALSSVVADYQQFLEANTKPLKLPLPHPSWRNNSWIKQNGWFEADYLPHIRQAVRRLV